jgi:glutamate dehydrogenase/leucine dehydrogenase
LEAHTGRLIYHKNGALRASQTFISDKSDIITTFFKKILFPKFKEAIMRIAVFGTGGVGGYFGGRLAQAGEEVVFIARGDHLTALQQNGLRIESIKGDFIIKPVQASDKPSQVGKVDVILSS